MKPNSAWEKKKKGNFSAMNMRQIQNQPFYA